MSYAVVMLKHALLLLLWLVASVNSDNCIIPWIATGHEVAESDYLIDLSIRNLTHGLARTYFPDTQYDIIIRPRKDNLSFKEFYFTMWNVNKSMSYGALELREPQLSTFSTEDYCINRVINLATPNKPNMTIGWQSPPTKSGCIELKAAVKETELRYHMANLTVCEDERIEFDDPGEILRNCCACEKAKYEMTFEGLWSKYNHPRGFPTRTWLAGFPTVVGAAHNPHYEIWNPYQNASDGLKKFADTGYSLALELELKAHKVNITTFIKFRGTNFKNKTLARAQLRVDRKNHVVSLVSKLDPSPDWFIGVSSLELCTKECTWMEKKILNLYTYDAGVRDGLTYEEKGKYTNDVINRMNMTWPRPSRDGKITPPFYDKTNNTHEVRPMARIVFRRIRVSGSTCHPIKTETIDEKCVSYWQIEHECTVTCGSGFKVWRREYLEGYNETNCNANLEKKELCSIPNVKCEDEFNCEMTEWSGWGKCMQSCGQESTERTRSYKWHDDETKCKEKFSNSLTETKDCGHPPCPSDKMQCNDDLYTTWTEWGPCTVTIGKGLQYRQRKKLKTILSKDESHPRLNEDTGFNSCLYDKKVCDGIDPASITESPVTEQEPGLDVLNVPSSHHRTRPRDCSLDIDEGTNCPGKSADSLNRWAYDGQLDTCVPFRYRGCNGNDNRFIDELECKERCILEEKVECQMSEWSPWSPCINCHGETKRMRAVLVEASANARPCPVADILQKKSCSERRECLFLKEH